MRIRDSQRSKVYAAEQEWRAWFRDNYPQHWISNDMGSSIKFVDKVLASKWFQSLADKLDRRMVTVEVLDGRGRRSAASYSWRNAITVPTNMRNKPVLLHELTHQLLRRHKVAAHGPEFAALMLRMVQHFLGKDAASYLRQNYRKHRVRTRAKRTRILTDEQRAALRSRLEAARAARALKFAQTSADNQLP